jgi:aminobenzoyl-glutamate transport protein
MKKLIESILAKVEKSVDKLPDPFFLFLGLAFLVIIISYLASLVQFQASNPTNGEPIHVVNLLSKTGIQRMLTNATANFMNFPPLGIVLITIIGIGIAEKSGFFKTSLLTLTASVPKKLIAPVLILISVNGSLMADSGVVLLPPLGAMLFASYGRHPIAGLLASFAAVCGGFSASFFITALDPLLSSFTDLAAKSIDPTYDVFPTANYYFMVASVFVVTAVCWYVTDKIVEPALQNTETKTVDDESEKPNPNARKAFLYGIGSVLVMSLLVLWAVLPDEGVLRDDAGTMKPLFRSIVTILMIMFAVSGIVYGYVAKTINNSKDIVRMSNEMMGTMGSYIVLVFAIGQFIAYFNDSNLGLIIAVKGAEFLRELDLGRELILLSFLFFSMIVNIFISSASAKWALLASVFVPMFMLLGISPESTQMMYRIGDSVTNFITPLFPYFPILIVFAKQFAPEITFGKLISLLLPYSFALAIIWGIMAAIWVFAGIPLGPQAPVFLD